MPVFEAHDAKAAEAVARLLSETVIWRPQLPPTGGVYTATPGGVPDPDRPIREMDAITSWQPTGLPVAQGATGFSTAVVTEATLMLDFEAELFRNEWAAYGQPKKGDRFECPEQDVGDRLLIVQRVGDDGSMRVYVWCAVVTE